MFNSGEATFKPLIFEKATPNSCERAEFRITTFGLFLLNALEKASSSDFRLVSEYVIQRCSICLRTPAVNGPFLLVESLQSIITVWKSLNCSTNLFTDASEISLGVWYTWKMCRLVVSWGALIEKGITN